MRKLIILLFVIVSTYASAQLKVKEVSEPKIIGAIKYGAFSVSELLEIDNNTIKWIYDNAEYKNLDAENSFNFSNANGELRDLYNLIRMNLALPPDKQIEVDFGDNKLLMKFKRNRVTISHYDKESKLIGSIRQLTTKEVKRLFGDNT